MLHRHHVFLVSACLLGCSRPAADTSSASGPSVASSTSSSAASAPSAPRAPTSVEPSPSGDAALSDGRTAVTETPVALRTRLAEGWFAGAAMRLDQPPHWRLTTPRAAGVTDVVAAMPARKGSERALTVTDLAKLADMLRAPSGFEDGIRKRCAMGPLVGFRILRRVASREERLDIALDTTCSKIFVVYGDDAAPSAHATHYDPSRSSMIPFLQRVLPDDSDLKKVSP